LPDKIKTDYTLAIPIIDTTISLGDFSEIQQYYSILDIFEVPANTPVNMGEQAYPFYIGEYSSSQEIEWIEPQIIIENKDLPSGTIVNIRICTKNDDDERIYFWLPSDYTVTLSNTLVKVPETPQKIEKEDINKFRSAKNIYLDTYITYPATMSGTEIVNQKVNIKFAVKFAIKTDLKINL
jgi:hypothetical protein